MFICFDAPKIVPVDIHGLRNCPIVERVKVPERGKHSLPPRSPSKKAELIYHSQTVVLPRIR